MAFSSFSSNLVPADTNGEVDVFVRDLRTGVTEIVSVSSTGEQGDDQSWMPAISADGRFVAFYSNATNLDPAHPSSAGEIYVRNREQQTTERVSLGNAGQVSGVSMAPSISGDGRFVEFTSYAPLIPEDTNEIADIYVRDRENGRTECASVPTGPPQFISSWQPYGRISSDGRYVAFSTYANNIPPGVNGPLPSAYVRDRRTGSIELISADAQGNRAPGASVVHSISADGRCVVFVSSSPSLVPGDTNGCYDVFVRDRLTSTTERVSVSSEGTEGDADSGVSSISEDGRYVAFDSLADNLVPGDMNGKYDVYLRDRTSGSTERISRTSAGLEGIGYSRFSSISGDGLVVAFESTSRLVPGDSNGWEDVFVRDRFGEPSFASLCSPGVDGVVPCPCSNASSRPERGCDNSSATGGAVLSAIGGTFVSSDSLEFRVVAETPEALSILIQGTVPLARGVIAGQGMRCVGGTIRKLFAKPAVGGSLLVPDFQALESTVSDRSAELGDRIEPGEQRWYCVLYRDPVVLGGCPGTSTFNSTQTGRIDWAP